MFNATNDGEMKGFRLKFENGWTVSIQFHERNYCDKDNSTAEMAAYDKHGNWYKFGGRHIDYDETVIGWQTPEQVSDFMHHIRGLGDEQSSFLSDDRKTG